jgi:DNA methylase
VKNNLSITLPEGFVTAVLDQGKVSGTPHEIYRYPARFSPSFAREAIQAFTRPGDLVLDPFCGGGTAVTEAVTLARRAAGMDINSLATFLTRAKTTPLTVHDARRITAWLKLCDKPLQKQNATETIDGRYCRHLPADISHFFARVLSRIPMLPKRRQQNFVRLVLLSVGQWALDCKANLPTVLELEREFQNRLCAITEQFRTFLKGVAENNSISACHLTRTRRIVSRSCVGCGNDKRIPSEWLPAKLVLTSPPYPGVHVLYHRWQIHGRRETPAPFWLTNQRDGAGESHYTFGDRNEPGLRRYFATLRATFSSIRQLLDSESLVVQLVGFSEVDWQLPKYLKTMQDAGFKELLPICDKELLFERRIWRSVPSRKWYAGEGTGSSREVLLLHKIAR